jgi:hypothetical protein
MGERLCRTLLPGLGEPFVAGIGGDAAYDTVSWSWRAWLSLEYGNGCVEPCYLVLESLVIAGIWEWLRRTLLLDLGEPGYRWNGGVAAQNPVT